MSSMIIILSMINSTFIEIKIKEAIFGLGRDKNLSPIVFSMAF